jgi:hypothetical protein
MTDDEMIELIENVDDAFAAIMVQHKVDVSELTGTVMARLLLVNQVMNNEKEFINLLQSIIDNPPNNSQTLQ